MDVRTLMRRTVWFNAKREAIVAGETRLSFEQAWERGVRLEAERGQQTSPGTIGRHPSLCSGRQTGGLAQRI